MKDACSLVCSFVRSGSRSFAPTVHSCLRRRAQTPSRSAVAQTTPQCPTSRGRTLDGGEHGGRLAWVGQKTIRRSGTATLEPAMLSTPSQLCAHGCIVPSSRSGLLYNVGEWERERPSHAVTAAPSNCVNGLNDRRTAIYGVAADMVYLKYLPHRRRERRRACIEIVIDVISVRVSGGANPRDAAHPKRRDRQALFLQFVGDPHLAPSLKATLSNGS